MAQHALPPGATRRRAVFGLLDAAGWGWAAVKATFWFLTIIFLLGYTPNLAYYFTVSKTIEVGANFISPINWCPSSNEDLPCPAPPGSVVPWQPSPPELALPSARSGAIVVQSGTHLYLVGGRAADGSVIPGTLRTEATLDGNFYPWADGPALPEPRADAAFASLSGVPYVIGGADAAGAPTTTVFQGEMVKGVLTGWALADGKDGRPDLSLKAPLAGATAVTSPTGIWLTGGRTTDDQLNRTLWRTVFPKGSVTLGPWEEMKDVPLPEARVDASGAMSGDYLYVLGGEGARGATRSVFRLRIVAAAPALDEALGKVEGWTVLPPSQSIPAARARAASFNANGTFYLIGGVDDTGALQYTTLWAIPSTGGALAWHYLDQSNMTENRADAAAAVLGPTAFLIGGEGDAGAVDGSFRGNLSPAPPFFQLGLFGATLPALGIQGEIGQQLGYINAMTVGMVNFALLVAIGLAFSHRRQTLRLFERLSRGRFRAPREDEYTPGS